MSEDIIQFDETLDFNKSEQYEISILFSKGGYSFIILDTIAKKIIARKVVEISEGENNKEYCYLINKILKKEEIINFEFKKVIISYQSQKSLLVPEDLYSKQHKDSLFKLSSVVESDEQVLTNSFSFLNAKKLFAVPTCFVEIINSNFPEAKIYHQSISIIESVFKNNSFGKVIINLHENLIDIHVFNESHLLLDNSFKYKTKEDLLYYILNIFEQLGLDTKQQKVLLYSSLKDDRDLIQFIKTYFLLIEMADLPTDFTYSYLFLKETHHRIAAQISFFECV